MHINIPTGLTGRYIRVAIAASAAAEPISNRLFVAKTRIKVILIAIDAFNVNLMICNGTFFILLKSKENFDF